MDNYSETKFEIEQARKNVEIDLYNYSLWGKYKIDNIDRFEQDTLILTNKLGSSSYLKWK